MSEHAPLTPFFEAADELRALARQIDNSAHLAADQIMLIRALYDRLNEMREDIEHGAKGCDDPSCPVAQSACQSVLDLLSSAGFSAPASGATQA